MESRPVIPKGAYAGAALRFVEAWTAYHKAACERDQSQDYRGESFPYHSLLDSLHLEPVAQRNFCRLNWKSMRPRLDISIYITTRHNLVMEATPWPEALPGGRDYYGMWYEDIQDFRVFALKGERYETAPHRILQIQLDGYFVANMAPRDWAYHLRPGRDLAAERGLCALLVTAKLHQLSLCFDCRMEEQLVCYGPDNYLDIRYAPRGGQRDSAQQDDYFKMDLRADERCVQLCDKYSLGTRELKEFAENYLIPEVPAERRRQTLAEYFGEPQTHLITDGDVERLLDYCDPTARRVRRLAEVALDAEGFAAYVSKNSYRWFNSFTSTFGLTASQGYDWVIEHHPALVEKLQFSGEYLRKKLSAPLPKTAKGREARKYFENHLVALWSSKYFSGMPSTLDRRLHSAAQGLAFSDIAALEEWAAKSCPSLCLRLDEVRAAAAERQAQSDAKKAAKK